MNINDENYVIWSLLLSNIWHPALPNTSSRSLEAISGTLMCKQEVVEQEAIVGMGLEVRVNSYHGREGVLNTY